MAQGRKEATVNHSPVGKGLFDRCFFWQKNHFVLRLGEKNRQTAISVL
jgi:hypothetical protein